MRKKNVLRAALLSAGMSVMVAANSLPCAVFADELNTANTEASAEESSADATGDTAQGGESTQRGEASGDRGSGKVSTTTSVQTVEEYDYDITVTFTKNRGVLTDISVTSDTTNKNNKYTSNALAQITEQLKSGSEADVVSGATYSSNAIIAAINEAGDYESVSADLTSSLNGETPTASQGGNEESKPAEESTPAEESKPAEESTPAESEQDSSVDESDPAGTSEQEPADNSETEKATEKADTTKAAAETTAAADVVATDSAKTGDSTSLLLFPAIAAVSAIALVVLSVRKELRPLSYIPNLLNIPSISTPG